MGLLTNYLTERSTDDFVLFARQFNLAQWLAGAPDSPSTSVVDGESSRRFR